ncbi:MAG: carbonate dehydratase [Verrucomicrobia bacterium]|nr:carbonate dehydratase [Verrucomicrobiota bacterium]
MSTIESLLVQNRKWAGETSARDPDFFSTLAGQQSPDYLWIGCSDSRVPANQIVGLIPGQIFVHRNVANVVVHTDLNCLSVMQFAIDVLHVKHILVVGHYGCGGVTTALRGRRLGLIDNWLRHVQDVRQKHFDLLEGVPDEENRANRLCELNVIEQVMNVCETTIAQDAWLRGQELTVHGLVYALQDGIIRDLQVSVSALGDIRPSYARALDLVRSQAVSG